MKTIAKHGDGRIERPMCQACGIALRLAGGKGSENPCCRYGRNHERY